MAIVRNFMVRAGADFSGLQKGMQKAQSQVRNFGNSINQSMSKISTVLAGIGVTLGIGSAVKDAMLFETSLNQINRIMGESAGEFNKWAQTTGAAFGYSKLEAVKAGATYGNLLSTFSSGADDTRKKTEELMKATAVVSSATGRTMEDTFERIRSGLLGNTEAIEDLGINVNVAMIESTNAFKQFANGASWQQLNFQTQQQIRYMAILEQATQKYGTTVADSTSVRMGTFVQSLNNVKLALGQAFLPILNVALPVLTVLANKVAAVMGVVAQFVRALIGKKGDIPQQTGVINNQTAAVNNLGAAHENAGKKATNAGKAAKKAAKEAKKASLGVAGFDEINQLADPSSGAASSPDSGGGGAEGIGGSVVGGGIPIPAMDTGQSEGALSKVSNKVKEFADKVKKFFAPLGKVFKQVYKAIKEYLQDKIEYIAKFWKENGKQMGQAWRNLMKILKPVFKWIVKTIWGNIKGAIDGLIDVVLGLLKIFTGVFTGDWKKAWQGAKQLVVGAVKAIWNIANLILIGKVLGGIKAFGPKIVSLFRDSWKSIGKFWDDGLKAISKNTTTSFKNIWIYIKGTFDDWVKSFKTYSGKFWTAITNSFKSVQSWFKTNVTDKITTVFTNAKSGIAKKADDIWATIKGKFMTVYNWFKTNVADKIATSIHNAKTAIAGKAGEVWIAIKNKFTGIYNWFRDNVAYKIRDSIHNAKTSIAGKAGEVWIAIKNKFNGIYNWFRDNVAYKIRDAIGNSKNAIGGKASEIWSTIKGKFTGVYDWFKKNVVDKISSAFDKIRTSFTNGLADGVKTLLNKLIDGINKPIKSLKNFSVPGFGQPFSNLPEIPKLAKGGITNGPTLALIGDNPGGKEVVSPLDKLQDIIAGAVGNAVIQANQGSRSSGTGGDIILQLDGRTFGRIIKPYIDKENQRVGTNVRLKPI
ncbi:phage tail protein [Bacillus sp. FJAT-18017]|uniref:phage tail protein n=1 Tax=Bacillus sp. FJAT-18017 TaxID=1705566 RepID=UPI0009ECA786|nr:hypothetical protein [Bacillus sp. FJAT-18017]